MKKQHNTSANNVQIPDSSWCYFPRRVLLKIEILSVDRGQVLLYQNLVKHNHLIHQGSLFKDLA